MSANNLRHSAFFIILGALISLRISVSTGLIFLLCINWIICPFSSIDIGSLYSNLFIFSTIIFLSFVNDSFYKISKSKYDYYKEC